MTTLRRMPEASADLAFLEQAAADPNQAASMAARFANGVQGYVDDRLADGVGWTSFDVSAVSCPVVVLHGGDDDIVDPVNGHHTASLLPQATLRIEPGHGHLSIIEFVVEPLLGLAAIPG